MHSLPRLPALMVLILVGRLGVAAAQERPLPKPMPHSAAGKEQCLSCHGPGTNEHIRSTPAAHRYAATACAMCHKPAAAMPPAASHPMDDAHATCAACHVEGGAARPPAASHAAYHGSICQHCHETRPAPPGSGW